MELLKHQKNSGVTWLLTLAALIVVVAGLKAGQGILVPFLFAVFLAILGSVPLNFLQKYRLPKGLAIFLVIIIFCLCFLGIGLLLSSSVDDFLVNTPLYTARLKDITSSINLWLAARGQEQISDLFLPLLQPEPLFELLGTTLQGLLSAVSTILVVFLLLMFMLNEAADFRLKLAVAFGDGMDLQNISSITHDVQKYLAIKTFTSALTGVLITIWLAYMGIDFPLLWGFVGMLLNYIPYIGSIIAAIPPILLALILGDMGTAAIITAGYIVINLSISNLIEPVFLGRRLGLSVLIVFLSLVFWGWIWGPAGALMAVPLTMIAKIFLEYNEDLRWLSVFMGNKASQDQT